MPSTSMFIWGSTPWSTDACTGGESYTQVKSTLQQNTTVAIPLITPTNSCVTSIANTHATMRLMTPSSASGTSRSSPKSPASAGTMDTMDCLHKEIRECKEALYCSRNDNCKCVHCLERAHALIRVFEEEEIANGLWVITPWVVECCREECGHSG
jgi:hypothetical protein